MSNLHIVTDSTGYIDKDYCDNNKVSVVRLSYMLDDINEKEGYPGSFDKFYKALKTSKSMPKTSQPSVGDFVDVFEDIIKNDGQILGIFIASKISGTFSSATQAAEIVGNNNITLIDSETTAATLRHLVERAVNLRDSGKTRQEIAQVIEEEKQSLSIALTVDTLDYLSKGGRISYLRASIGNFLSLKPILQFEKGIFTILEKARGRKKALDRIESFLPANLERLSICHIMALDDANSLKESVKAKYPDLDVTIEDLGPVIGSHLGPGTIGICYKK